MDYGEKIFDVVEYFKSINGEAMRMGELALFIRFKGCNLSCSYCDTKWANEDSVTFEKMSCKQILKIVKDANVRLVTLTGGEPLLQNNIDSLIEYLTDNADVIVEVETNGSVDISRVKEIPSKRVSITLDYKLPSSGSEGKMLEGNYLLLDKSDSVKFVVGDRADLEKAKLIIEKYDLSNRSNVLLSPTFGLMEPREIVEYMIDENLKGVRLQLQIHKYIWDPETRGV